MKFTLKLTPLLLLVTLAAAQNSTSEPAEIQTLDVLRVGADLKIEITLSKPVQPGVMLANHPDRLVLDFPNTSSDAHQQREDVNEGGVKAIPVWIEQHQPTGHAIDN
jgi:AMIN domain-containing protein